jgi:hypothetical protein
MRLLLGTMLAVVLAAASARATVLFEENWENGMDRWRDAWYTQPYASLSDVENATPGGNYSLKTADTREFYTNAVDYDFQTLTENNWYLQFKFFDTGTAREYLQIRSYSNGGLKGDHLRTIMFGVWPYTVDPNKYSFRVMDGGYGWTNTTVSRTTGSWRTMRVEQDFDGVLKFMIDGYLAYEAASTVTCGVSSIRVGSALDNFGMGAYFDDIEVGIVPEPAALLMLLAGVPMLLRRRH